ncbi:MAG: RNA methylase [Flavobacteriales bacterium]|nr:RNA methylase [Flavobacteriales bacterium]
MELCWHTYRYFPYERDLALREVQSLLSPEKLSNTSKGIKLEGGFDVTAMERLVYFALANTGGHVVRTMQGRLEQAGEKSNRQATRYSVHGLHEYKGKFNPQVVRAILNILDVPLGARVLDPFCGSGTSLVECTHLGMSSTGTDINPLAVFVANAKLLALATPSIALSSALDQVVREFQPHSEEDWMSDNRSEYLRDWFDLPVLADIEGLKRAIGLVDVDCQPVLLTIASNLLREYSQQDPTDLRIRRRKTPIPSRPFVAAFQETAKAAIARIKLVQGELGVIPVGSRAHLVDVTNRPAVQESVGNVKFDAALTSPPYATALPYIDTQRLSLVWLSLIPPNDILRLESRLVGSRELRGLEKKSVADLMRKNEAHLPNRQAEYCQDLSAALGPNDGFRRKAVPVLLYRYFNSMANAFRSVRARVPKNAPFALIVGGNHTILGGRRFDIDTPQHLAEIAEGCGWSHQESIALQTYQRYGYHVKNAVNSEALVILRAS